MSFQTQDRVVHSNGINIRLFASAQNSGPDIRAGLKTALVINPKIMNKVESEYAIHNFIIYE